MPTYFFHLHNDVDTPDFTGTDLPNLMAATAYAADMVRFEIAEAVKQTGRIDLTHRIDVEDDGGQVLATIPFGDAVVIRS